MRSDDPQRIKNTTGKTASSGRFCHSRTSSRTASVTRPMRSGETSVPYSRPPKGRVDFEDLVGPQPRYREHLRNAGRNFLAASLQDWNASVCGTAMSAMASPMPGTSVSRAWVTGSPTGWPSAVRL